MTHLFGDDGRALLSQSWYMDRDAQDPAGVDRVDPGGQPVLLRDKPDQPAQDLRATLGSDEEIRAGRASASPGHRSGGEGCRPVPGDDRPRELIGRRVRSLPAGLRMVEYLGQTAADPLRRSGSSRKCWNVTS